MQDETGRFSCLRCGTEMEYDWMACPECGWKATDDGEGEEEGSGEPVRSAFSGSWVKWAAWSLILAILFLIFWGLF